MSVVVLAVKQERRPPAPAAPVRAAAAGVSLPRLDGQGRAPLPSGKVTLVDFWATWCAPCRVSMPRVQQIWQEYSPKGMELYSVDTDDANADRDPTVREFLLTHRLTFPVVLDDGSASSAFSIESLPTMLLLNRQGQVVWQHVGALNDGRERELRTALEMALR